MKTPLIINLSILKNLERTPPSGSKAFTWDLEVRGFGAWKNQMGRITFVYQYRSPLDRRTRRVTLGQLGELTIRQARDMSRDLASAVRKGIDPREEKRAVADARKQDETLLLRNVVPIYYAQKELKAPVDRNVRRSLENDILPALGDMHIGRIPVTAVESMLIDLAKRSPSAARHALASLKVVLNYAKRTKRIVTAVTDGMETPKSNKRERAFSPFEIARFLEAVHDLGGKREAMLTTIFLLLRRVNEVAQMTWEEVDQVEWAWRLPGPRSKNRQPQRLILPRQVVAIITSLHPDPKTRRGAIFSPNKSMRDISSKVWDMLDANLDRRLELHEAKSGKPRPAFAHYTLHDGRTTAATLLQKKPLSFPPHIIEAALNHATQEHGIKAVYQLHRYADEVGDMLQRWADYVDGVMAAADTWPGGRALPFIEIDEREARATNLRADWTKRKLLAKRSAREPSGAKKRSSS
ncbi:MAG: integrase family protein [Sphingomonas adhaesiva]|uniref:tyrosine-type recombinase/integrase n=1 Tax=Sphingomonas adhaesiva TaxID=28212 RepID=UPI002FF8B89C